MRLGPAAAQASYLDIQAVISAARRTGAGAVHPGYGFLSENGDFVAALAEAGITFIGPPASAIAAMGDKSAAKARMHDAGVPLVPGYHATTRMTPCSRPRRIASAIRYYSRPAPAVAARACAWWNPPSLPAALDAAAANPAPPSATIAC